MWARRTYTNRGDREGGIEVCLFCRLFFLAKSNSSQLLCDKQQLYSNDPAVYHLELVLNLKISSLILCQIVIWLIKSS